jgi:hypothetical protein
LSLNTFDTDRISLTTAFFQHYRGDTGKTLEGLNRAHRQRNPGLPEVKTEPLMKSLRQSSPLTEDGSSGKTAPTVVESPFHRSEASDGVIETGLHMVFLTAARCHGVDAAVAYHGGDTEKCLGEVDGPNAPLLMHLAGEDEFISKPAQAEIKAALAKKPNTTVYSYPGQNHAFSRHRERIKKP